MTAQERRTMVQPEQNILMYDVPISLNKEQPFMFSNSEDELYRIPVDSTDVGQMLREVRHRVSRNAINGMEEIRNSPLREFSQFYSFFDLSSSGSMREARKNFSGVLGEVKLNGPMKAEFSDFYQVNNSSYHNRRLFMDTRGQISNRGSRYYVAIDSAVGTAFEKMQVMREDMIDAAKILEQVDRNTIQDPESFLQYIGVLDYLKQHSLCLFHAVTYPERFSDFSSDETYEQVRSYLWEATRTYTRSYYQALCGLPFDEMNIPQLMENLDTAMNYLVEKDPPVNQFKLQEIDHPLIIGMAAFQTVKTFPTVDQLICLPSGGTQFGIATELMYEYMSKKYGNGEVPVLSSLVVSTHAGRRGNGTLLGRDDLVTRLDAMEIQGKSVLILDDNTNTGLTLQITSDALRDVGARSVSISLTELDPLRILYKQTSFEPPEYVANLNHPDLYLVSSIVPIVVFEGSRDMQLRKIVAQSKVKLP